MVNKYVVNHETLPLEDIHGLWMGIQKWHKQFFSIRYGSQVPKYGWGMKPER